MYADSKRKLSIPFTSLPLDAFLRRSGIDCVVLGILAFTRDSLRVRLAVENRRHRSAVWIKSVDQRGMDLSLGCPFSVVKVKDETSPVTDYTR
jgi:hypothetical protein